MKTKQIALVLVLSGALLSGCDSYWWNRGQPPAPSALAKRSSAELIQALGSSKRSDIRADVEQIQASVANILQLRDQGDNDALRNEIASAQTLFMNLEQRLSVTSRPAMAELGGQLRAFSSNDANTIDRGALNMFASRVYFLLANELSVPAPLPVTIEGGVQKG